MIEKTPIYLVPGLAASSKIFEFLQFDNSKYEITYLDWLVPNNLDEPIAEYAKRMCERIKHENPILIGVSFGGVMVQEMSKLIDVEKTIIISSVKCRSEMPNRMKFIKGIKLYKLFPTKIVSNIENYTKYSFGTKLKKRVALYEKYLSMRDKTYLPWAIEQVLHWEQEKPMPDIFHIHGDQDQVFPIKHVNNCTTIEGGTHVMVINKAKKISRILQETL